MDKSKRKFHKTTITVVVLSEDPYQLSLLSDVSRDIVDGDCAGSYTVTQTEELNGCDMAKELMENASDPEFFRLTEDGCDDEDQF